MNISGQTYLNRLSPFPRMLWISCQALEDKYRKNIKIVHLAKPFLLLLLYPPGKSRLLNWFFLILCSFCPDWRRCAVHSATHQINDAWIPDFSFLRKAGRTSEAVWLDFALETCGKCSTLAIPRRLAGASGDWPRQKSNQACFNLSKAPFLSLASK